MLRPIPILAAAVLLVATLAGCTSSTDDAPLLGPSRSDSVTPPTLAHALVWPTPSTLKVEIDFVAGRAPEPFALQELERMLRAETDKATIEILDPTEVDLGTPSEDREWTPEALSEAHEAAFDNADEPDRDVVWLHFLFVDGTGEKNDDGGYFVGMQQQRFLSILPDSAKNALTDLVGLTSADDPLYGQAQANIVIHEAGHALGLVGKEAPMLTERLAPEEMDPCRCHSGNEDSVMYPNVENFNPVRFIQEGQWSRYTFDADDKADLQALRDSWEP